MMRSYSGDLRIRVIGGISGGLSTGKAAQRYGIGKSTAGAWYRRYLETGEVSARKQGKPPGSKLDDHENFILGLVRKQPDISRYQPKICRKGTETSRKSAEIGRKSGQTQPKLVRNQPE